MAKGVHSLHHANSVQTACLFLQQGRLLARGTVEERGFHQTAQISDDMDRSYGIWYDIFLDSVDIHARASQRNFYGPVLFVIDLSVFDERWLSTVWITKKNPTKWRPNDAPADRYFQSIDELERDFVRGNFGQMIMLRHVGGVLRLGPYLKELVVDDPHWTFDGLDVYAQTIGALRASAWQGRLGEIAISRRTCPAECGCSGQYKKALEAAAPVGESTLRQFFFLEGEP